MNIGILSVRDGSYHPNRRLMEAASRAGHSISLIHTRDCLSVTGSGLNRLEIRGMDLPDVLLPRIGATINDYAMGVVRQFELSGVSLVNGFQSILVARNKFLTLQTLACHGVNVPHTFLVVNFQGFERAVEALGGYPVVAKLPVGRQGTGLLLVDSPVTAAFAINNLQEVSKGMLVQEYMPPGRRREIRAFVVGDRVVGAMELSPVPGDFRSNIHLKGQGRRVTLDRDLGDLALRSVSAVGLEIAGADIMIGEDGAPKVVEVNYSPGFRGLERVTKLDIAAEIVRYLEHRAGDRRLKTRGC